VVFNIEIFMEICREFENLVKVVQKYRAFYVRTQIRLIVLNRRKKELSSSEMVTGC
jgi:hypothetical protein